MAGRPQRRARIAAAGGRLSIARTPESAARSCPKGYTPLTIAGRLVCTDHGVTEWLRTGRGFSEGFTVGGTPAKNLEDLTRAVRQHITLEKQHAALNARSGIDSKYETRSLIEDDEYGQGLWLWLNTHVRGDRYPRNSISVTIDHG